ncbi:hypothetical protein ACRFE4_17190, partial [Klebsiella pneumoniae]
TDGDGSHGSTSKTPSYTKSVSWHHYRIASLQRPKYCGLQGMAFNWQGNTLILVYRGKWLRVRMPDGMQDAASADAIPEQG